MLTVCGVIFCTVAGFVVPLTFRDYGALPYTVIFSDAAFAEAQGRL